MTFNPITDPIDKIRLAGRLSPGTARITNCNSPRRWDERRGYALSGSRVIFRGIGLAHPIVTLTLLTNQDWVDWHNWKELVQRPPRLERARAIDIWHPILEDQGVRSIVVEDVGQANPVGDNGEYAIVIKMIEFRRPVRAVVSPEASEPRQLDPVEQRIQNLRNQVTALAAA